MKWGT